jgi:hypothetical protein
MILPWAHSLISAGAHGLRRIPGQSVNLAHPLFGAHHAPRPLIKVHPRWFSARGYGCCFTLQPQFRVSPDTIKL